MEKPTHEQITEAMMQALASADHLVNEYTRGDQGYGTGVGMRSAEDKLIRDVFAWRRVCGSSEPKTAHEAKMLKHAKAV